ncbi:MAG: MarR family transcriptional regulator [Pseudomonadota bacterium]
MFFLKTLPTQAMVKRYSDDYSDGNADIISNRLKTLREYSLLIRAIDEYFASHGLSQLRFLVLMVIDREAERDSLYAHEVADRLDVSKPVLSRAIKKLIEQSYLHSEKDSKDSRASTLSITKQGSDKLASVLPGYFQILTEEPSE